MKNLFIYGAGLLLVSVDASATEYFGEFGGWDVYEGDDACLARMEFEGPGSTNLAVIENSEGVVAATITNSNWSAKQGERYQVAYVLNGQRYYGEATGWKDYVRAGFISKFSNDFAEDFAKGSSLHIYLGEQKIDNLSLKGTALAMQAVKRCLVVVKAQDRKDTARIGTVSLSGRIEIVRSDRQGRR